MVPTLPAPVASSSSPVASASALASAAPATPKEPEIPALKPAENATCVFAENDIELAASLPLRVDDSPPFVYVGRGRKVEVRLAGPRSTASIANDDRDLIGHVSLGDVTVRPKSSDLVDGFVRVRQAHLKPLSGASGRYVLGYELPSHVRAEHESHVEVSCGDVSLARSTGAPRPPAASKPIHLQTGAPIALRSTPGGPKVATILLPKPSPNAVMLSAHADEVERKGADVKIVMRGNGTDVEGWISSKDLAKPPSSSSMGLLGLIGSGAGENGPKELAVSRETPLYARRGARVVRVGTVRSGTLTCVPSKGETNEVAVDLEGAWGGAFGGLLGSGEIIGGLGSMRGAEEEHVTVFVKPAAGETCLAPKKK